MFFYLILGLYDRKLDESIIYCLGFSTDCTLFLKLSLFLRNVNSFAIFEIKLNFL